MFEFQKLKKALSQLKSVKNNLSQDTKHHPAVTYAGQYKVSAQDAVDIFSEAISAIVENNYGDFMRKANAYQNQMVESFANQTPETKKNLRDMKMLIQYLPNEEVETTRTEILILAKKLRNTI